MPIVEAHILQGYRPEEKQRLVAALTDAVRFVVPAPDEAITVFLSEHAPEAYARGGVHRQPAAAAPDPGAIVRDYLAAMEARDLTRAKSYLGAGFFMVFPGDRRMSDLDALVAWSKDRYRFVKKTFDSVEAFHGEGCAVVYTRGTLYGEWPDGTPFDGIRFIDRFELREGLITRQDVWNDLAEVKAS
jgi:4-oxalocrotonate tautomerase family enzyme